MGEHVKFSREAIVALIREAADRGFEAGQQGDVHFRFGDLIAKADALLQQGGAEQ